MRRIAKAATFGSLIAGLTVSLAAARADGPGLPEGPGKALVIENCSNCHGVDLITAKRRTPAEWDEVMNRMLANGAPLTDDQSKQVTTYLVTYLGKNAATGNAAAGAAAPAAAHPSAPVRPGERG